MPEDVLTQKLESFMAESKEHRDEVAKVLTEIMRDGKDNLIQSIKTNGRVTRLEQTASQHSIAIEAFQELRWWVKGAFWLWCAIMPALVFAAPFALKYYVHKVAAEELDKAVEKSQLLEYSQKGLSTPVK